MYALINKQLALATAILSKVMANPTIDTHSYINTQDSHGSTALLQASLNQYKNITQTLLNNQADPSLGNQMGNALHYVAHVGSLPLVTRILRSKPDLIKNQNSNGKKTPLIMAIEEKKANPSLINLAGTALHYAAHYGLDPLIPLILGASPTLINSQESSDGNTPLIVSIEAKQSETATYLLKKRITQIVP